MEEEISKISDCYYEKLGGLPQNIKPTNIDKYRYKFIFKYLVDGNLLDVGTWHGDFLKLALDKGIEAKGTDINDQRVEEINSRFNKKVTFVDFKHGKLNSLPNNCFSNVVCMEVLEHVENYRYALNELLRVGKKRVIITVPFKNKETKIICPNCCKHISANGHMHFNFNLNSFDQIIPKDWKISQKGLLGNIACRLISKQIKNYYILFGIDRLMSTIYPKGSGWMYIIFDKR